MRGGRRPAAGCRRPKDGAGQRPAGAGLEFVSLAPCVGKSEGKGGQRNKPSHEGTAKTKIPKIPKIPIVLDVIRWSKQLH